MMRITLFTLLLSFIVGCSSDEVSENGDNKVTQDKGEVVCERVKKTGSHFFVKRCRTRAEIEQERENARRMLDKKLDTTGGNDS